MSTHPDGTTRDADLIREVLARESETVTRYLHLAAQAEDPVTRDLILHLAKEEKEHIAECAKYLTLLDGAYRRYFERDLSTFLDHATGGRAPAGAPAAARAAVATPEKTTDDAGVASDAGQRHDREPTDVATEPTVGALDEAAAPVRQNPPGATSPPLSTTPRSMVGPVVGHLTVGGLFRRGHDD